MAKNTYTKVGAVFKGKEENGGGTYIKLSEGIEKVTLKAGQTLRVQDPRKELDKAVEAGRMEAEKANYLKGKVPNYILFEIVHVSKND